MIQRMAANMVEKTEEITCSGLPGRNEDCTCARIAKVEIGTGFDANVGIECRIENEPFSDPAPRVVQTDKDEDPSLIEWSRMDRS